MCKWFDISRCDIKIHGIWRTFDGIEASEAYAAALLYLFGGKGIGIVFPQDEA